jgi:PAS domain S-box-containing protein
MLNRVDAPAKLYLLVFVLSAFITCVSIYGFVEMRAMDQNTRTLYQDRVYPLAQLGEIRFSYCTILYTLQQIAARQVSSNQAVTAIERSEDSINVNWDAYKLTYLAPQEKLLANQASGLLKQVNAQIDSVKAILKTNGNQALKPDAQLYNGIVATIEQITALKNLQVSISRDIYRHNHNSYLAAIKQFIIVTLLLLAFAVPFCYILIKNIKDLIFNLNDANIKTKAAEEKYRSFIQYAGDAIFAADHSSNIIDVNDSCCNLLGYTRNELLAMKVSDIITPADEEGSHLELNQLVEPDGTLHERKILVKGSNVIDNEVNMRQLDGGAQIAILRDITEKKRVVRIISESEEKYKYLFENNPACIIIWEIDTLKVLEVNNAVVEKYGYSKLEMKQMTLLDYRHPPDHDKTRAFAQLMQAINEPVLNIQWTHINKSGTEMMEVSSYQIVFNGINAVLSLCVDVTERVSTQTALKKSEEKFYSLVDYAADGIFMVADNGVIFDVNRGACQLLGYAKDELIGKSVVDLHLPEIRVEIPGLWEHLRQNKSFNDERRLLKKDGSHIEVEISRTMLPDASGAIAIVRDISLQKRHLQEIEDQNMRLKEIAWIQSHLVRAPVATILGLTQLFEADDSTNAEIIPKLIVAAEQLDVVIKDITRLTDSLM